MQRLIIGSPIPYKHILLSLKCSKKAPVLEIHVNSLCDRSPTAPLNCIQYRHECISPLDDRHSMTSFERVYLSHYYLNSRDIFCYK